MPLKGVRGRPWQASPAHACVAVDSQQTILVTSTQRYCGSAEAMQDPPPAPSAAAEPAAERDEAREARETLKKEWDEAIKKTKPKDTAAGLKSGIATAAAGVASGVVGLFAAPIVGAKQDGASGFAKGLATGKQQEGSRGPSTASMQAACTAWQCLLQPVLHKQQQFTWGVMHQGTVNCGQWLRPPPPPPPTHPPTHQRRPGADPHVQLVCSVLQASLVPWCCL